MSGQPLLDEVDQSAEASGEIEEPSKVQTTSATPGDISIDNNTSLAQALEPAATPMTTIMTTTPTPTTFPTTVPTTVKVVPVKKKKKAAKHVKHFNVVKTEKRYIKYLNSKVECKIAKQKKPKRGVLKWVGYLPNFPHKLIAGVELDTYDNLGTNGSYQSKRYFITKPGRGYFFQLKQCRKMTQVAHG